MEGKRPSKKRTGLLALTIYVDFLSIFYRLKIPFNGHQRQKQMHIHKGQDPFNLFIHLTVGVCLLLVDSKTTAHTCLQIYLQNGVCVGKEWKKTKKFAIIIGLIQPFHVKYIKFHCLNLLSKPENGRKFHNYRKFHSIELRSYHCDR